MGSWYSLDTNRKITKINNMYYLNLPNVASSNIGEISEFLYLNNINLGEITADAQMINFFKDDLKRYNNNYSEVADIPHNLHIWNWCYLTGRCKIVYIVDGDTLDFLFTLTGDQLSCTHWTMVDKRPHLLPSAVLSGSKDFKITVKLRARLYGFDALEHDTEGGQVIKQVAADLFAKYNNDVYVRMLGSDKWGRVLTNFYADREFKISLNDYLCNYTDPVLGKLATPYFGGSKKEAWTE